MMDEEQAATVSAGSTLHEGIDTTKNTANRKDHASETRSTVLSPPSDALNSMNIENEATFSENRHDEHPFNTDSSHVFDEQDGQDLDEQKVQDATTGQAELTRTTSSIKYIEGLKLYFLMASLTLIFFLVMIDMSIIATVCRSLTILGGSDSDIDGIWIRQFQKLPPNLIPLKTSGGMELHIYLHRTYLPTPGQIT